MSNLNKIDVPIAIEHKTKLDLSCDSVTTMRFMTLQPVNYRHMIKTEHISLNSIVSVRPAPIEVPVFGSLKQNLRYFFVPYRLVFPNWDSFYNDVIASNVSDSSLVQGVPFVSNTTFQGLFSPDSSYRLSEIVDDVSQPYDFVYNGNHCRYTLMGRFVIKLLRSLGYEVIWRGKDFRYNALSLLAFCRVFVDWYANSQYLNSQDVLRFERLCKFNDPTSQLEITEIDLWSLVGLVGNVVYDVDDYYVNAWDNPVSPNSGQYTAFSFADPTSNGGAFVSTNSMGTPEMFGITGSGLSNPQVGTTYIHEALKRLTDFQKRHALAGARSIDRVLAQYGIVTDSLRQQRSIYLGNQETNIEIGSIYATGDGETGDSSSRTGDYSGAGYGSSSHTIDFTADEEGILLCIATIIPQGRMVQGYDRNNRHLTKSDFFVPEFDALGVQAIEKGEVYVSSDEFFGDTSDYSGVFGFTGRYGEYKRPKSFLTGDITIPSVMQGGNSWHLFRLFNDGNFGDAQDLVHSLQFTRGFDNAQYHRIFQYTLADVDPFYCFFHFNIASYVPCRPLFESYEFESESKRVPTENGNKVN